MSELPQTTLSIEKTQGELEERELAEVRELAAAAQEHDGNPPLSDQTLVALGSEEFSEKVFSLRAEQQADPRESTLVGVVAAVRDPQADSWVVELVVHPQHRQQGIASALVQRLGEELELSRIQAWAHGGHPAAKKLAEVIGLATVRELHKLRRESPESLEIPQLDRGSNVRTFRVGEDEPAWLAANAAAFADHPEQGSLTLADLDSRMAESWFDPAGFFLAFDAAEQVIAFHWTKIHPATGDSVRPLGEVYVVGVVPEAQGLGLGRVLTALGVNYLLEMGVGAVLLYVDAENQAAVSLYRSLGFTLWDTDIMYGPQPIES
ncbi:mycothiol synthase [Glutamicibacter sp. BW80]|uniref:mycothiol synthase n=1 Tax=unclassified Glutamicibacter TaxID=2627139 RepID=UPI000BB70BF4|nr:mycothiol synthase [Glutamicibacter sp. BW80]PCC29952.1 mycothiol synthase [Glutamicibacter sp. BW80]